MDMEIYQHFIYASLEIEILWYVNSYRDIVLLTVVRAIP